MLSGPSVISHLQFGTFSAVTQKSKSEIYRSLVTLHCASGKLHPTFNRTLKSSICFALKQCLYNHLVNYIHNNCGILKKHEQIKCAVFLLSDLKCFYKYIKQWTSIFDINAWLKLINLVQNDWQLYSFLFQTGYFMGAVKITAVWQVKFFPKASSKGKKNEQTRTLAKIKICINKVLHSPMLAVKRKCNSMYYFSSIKSWRNSSAAAIHFQFSEYFCAEIPVFVFLLRNLPSVSVKHFVSNMVVKCATLKVQFDVEGNAQIP